MKYNLNPKKINCPICKNQNGLVLWQATNFESAQNFVLKETNEELFNKLANHIKKMWGQDFVEMVKCDNCNFCFSDPFIAGEEIFYNLANEKPNYVKFRWEFGLTKNQIEKNIHDNYKLLEIGSGDGAFIQTIADSLVKKENILCNEFSQYGRRKIEELGINCNSIDITQLNDPAKQGYFDAICMFQVLEHVNNLNTLFNKFNWLLKENGNLFISVPNNIRIEFNELNDALLDMPPNHVGRWNVNCFKIIGKQHGFEIIDHQIESQNYLDMAKQIVFYRFKQNSQRKGSTENKIYSIQNQSINKLMKIFGFGINIFKSMPVLLKMKTSLGDSQWVQMRKLA